MRVTRNVPWKNQALRGVPQLQVKLILLLKNPLKIGDHDLFFFFPKQTKISLLFFSQDPYLFPFSLFFFKNLSPFSLSDLRFSFSLGEKPLETPRLFSHAFSFPSCRVSPQISQKPPIFSSTNVSSFPFLSNFPPQHLHHTFLFLFQLWKSPPSSLKPQLIYLPSSQGEQLPLITS